MPQKQYVQKPYKVNAEPYDAYADPLQPGVCRCVPDLPPHVHVGGGELVILAVGDWIVQDAWSPHAWHVIPDEEFQDRFGGTGPPTLGA